MSKILTDKESAEKLVYIAIYAARIMLESGAEIYRVEDTAARICGSYENVQSIDVFSTYTVIIVSMVYDNKVFSSMKRIKLLGINLDKISKVNDFSRQFVQGNIDFENSYEILKKINAESGYSERLRIISLSLVGFGFTMMFGGSVRAGLCSILVVFIEVLTLFKLKEYKLQMFGNALIGALVASSVTCILMKLGIAEDLDKIIIGSIMPLVPGMSITNSIRDLMSGDTLSGMSGIMMAILIAVAIALGVGIVLSIYVGGM